MPPVPTESHSSTLNQTLPVPSAAEEPSVSTNPPSIFVFNVGLTRTRHTNDGPVYGESSFFQSFINTLKSINDKGYVVQAAMYGPEGVNIFIDTEDEDWHNHVSCH